MQLTNSYNTAFATRPQAQKLPFAKQQSNNVLQFTGGSQNMSKGKTLGKKKGWAFKGLGALGLLLASAFAPFVSPAPASAQSASPETSHAVVYEGEEVCIDENVLPFVDEASQLSEINQARTVDPVIDLCHNPLLSPETQQRLQDFLNEYNFRSDNSPQLAIVTIPDTHNGEIGTLATDLGNQMGIGQDEQDNGMLYLINAQGTRDAESPMMFIAKGSGVDVVIKDSHITDILVKHALPEIKNKNYDAAVEKTLDAVTELMENPSEAIQNDTGWWAERSDAEKTAIIVGVVILALFLLMVVAAASEGGYSSGGSYYGGSSSSGGSFGGGFSSSGGGSFGGGGFSGGGGGI